MLLIPHVYACHSNIDEKKVRLIKPPSDMILTRSEQHKALIKEHTKKDIDLIKDVKKWHQKHKKTIHFIKKIALPILALVITTIISSLH
jgi:hypothetical protein